MMDKQKQRDQKVHRLAMIQRAKEEEENTFKPQINREYQGKKVASDKVVRPTPRERTILYDVCVLNNASQRDEIVDKGALDPNAPSSFEKSGKKYQRTDVKH